MNRYPYPENRVYLSAAIAGLSIILALALLLNQPILTIYYFLSTIMFTATTFLLKRRLYTFLRMEKTEEKKRQTEERTPWKALLLVLLMSLALLLGPLLFAEILSGPVWFIMIVSFTSGVSISEIVLYLQMRQ